jgi:catechol 2,3-dioxygenase-like lactoylglutathione lyase family enzyme
LIRPFLPAKDFEQSKAFYTALGFTIGFQDDTLAVIEEPNAGGSAFFLQNYYQPDWAGNFMLDWAVDDLNAWFAAAQPLVEALGGKGPTPPELKPWGLVMSDFIDPAGVLWHVQERPKGAGRASCDNLSMMDGNV